MIIYYWNKLLKKLRCSAIRNSMIHKTSKVESGSHVVDSNIGKYSFCGYDCKIYSCEIGAFCSIADGVVIGGAEHPIRWVSSSPAFYAGRDSVRAKFSEHKCPNALRTIIGNDVWIGEKAIIKAGITIGDGAVVGMGSVVTKDVAPYMIVAGVPAKMIRQRFSNDICCRLLESKWWNFNEKKLRCCAAYVKYPERFLQEALK